MLVTVRVPDVCVCSISWATLCGCAAQLKAVPLCDQLTVERLYVGPLMTALDMNGFSLTLMEVDEARLEMLDAPTQVCTRSRARLDF